MNAYSVFNKKIEQARKDYPHFSLGQAQDFCRIAYSEIYALMLSENPRAKQRLVNEAIQERSGRLQSLINDNMSRGLTYDQAYNIALRENVSLANEMQGRPPGSIASADGQHLSRSSDTASGEEIKRLGLPLNASSDAIQMFRAAEQVKLTPEIAALVVRSIVQFSQVERAATFDQVLEHLKNNRRELYAEARKARPASN